MTTQQSPVYIVGAARTPIGSFQGTLSSLSAPSLGSIAVQGALKQAGVSADQVQDVILGCVLTAGIGQAPARQAMLAAGIPNHVSALTINKVCASGLKATELGAAQIQLGHADVVVTGGMESMSNVPYYLPNARTGYRMGHQQAVDGMILDGLWDPYNDFHMGNAGELCAAEYKFTREAQDAFAAESYRRSQASVANGTFAPEIAPVSIPQRKGDPLVVDVDEEPGRGNIDKLAALKPAFQRDGGTVTAGNASTLNDGAAALVLASQAAVDKHGLTPVAKILGAATHSQAPEWFTTAPVGAMKKLFACLSLTPEDMALYEINEAFAMVAMAAMHDLNLPHDKVNVRGGAVSLGHPIGASGARILVTLVHALQSGQKGCAAICNGGGEGVAMVVERV